MEASSIGIKGKHWKEKALAEMTERDWRIFREDFNIMVRGGKAPVPLRDWSESGQIPELVLAAIKDLKYAEPSPIQRQAIPIGLAWRDVIGIAETGSGKTCAFVVPMLAYIANLPDYRRERLAEEGPLAMVMAPTRELAQQIEAECIRLCAHTGYKTVSVVGGQSIQDQGFLLREGVEVLVGTPGRMKDAIESRYLVLNQCNYVVLDEADRMVDMGFEAELNFVLDSMAGLLKSEAEDEAYQQEEAAARGEAIFRVTAMFSATMPAAVERMAKKYLRHPAIVSIGDRDSGRNMRIEQVVEMVSEAAKANKLIALAAPKTTEDKIIVFVNEKKRCDMVARTLEKANIRCSILHGGKSQDQREESLASFRAGHFQVLVATDVAGRGLDIPDVSLVLNYDMPAKIENYCHRIGRTGRAGKNGVAITLLTEADSEVFYDLKKYLESTEANIPHALARHPAAAAAPGSITEGGKSATARKDQVIFAK
jgi:ATP-dependent RNA helicase DDX23/PRP28